MTLQVFSLPDGNDPKMFFDLNGQEYEMHVDPNKRTSYDIVVLGGPTIPNPIPNCKMALELQIWHNYENQSLFGTNHPLTASRSSSNTVILTNAIDPIIDGANWVIYNDFLFNRTKAYYQNYPFNPNTTRWYHTGSDSYVMPELSATQKKQKIFVSANNTYAGSQYRRIKYRPQIVSALKNHINLGYLGNHDVDTSLLLYTEKEFPGGKIEEIEASKHFAKYGPWGYNPPHSEYYKNTFISIYGETIEYGTTLAATEKTYDPLIKGHFILPFSTNGFILYLKSKGFKFPDFIDYSYDNIVNDDLRFKGYTDEVFRLLNIGLDQWQQHWYDNFNIIQHNRNVFLDSTYDRVDLTKYF